MRTGSDAATHGRDESSRIAAAGSCAPACLRPGRARLRGAGRAAGRAVAARRRGSRAAGGCTAAGDDRHRKDEESNPAGPQALSGHDAPLFGQVSHYCDASCRALVARGGAVPARRRTTHWQAGLVSAVAGPRGFRAGGPRFKAGRGVAALVVRASELARQVGRRTQIASFGAVPAGISRPGPRAQTGGFARVPCDLTCHSESRCRST